MRFCNKKVKYDGFIFDSMTEFDFYIHLKASYKSIIVHPRFELLSGFKYRGKKILPIIYEGDIQIGDVVYDVKGTRYVKKVGVSFSTPCFKLKAKMFKNRYPDKVLLVVFWDKYKKEWVYED